jgi:outer membrane protein assembly factor BamE (lipoprotein component of BamABCDE complex)
MKYLLAFICLIALTACGTTYVKPYDRSKITKGFTQTEDALADARKYTSDAKEQVRNIKSNSQRIDNKAGVILKNWR